MKTYQGDELNKKIESFMDKKMEKFPELAKKDRNPIMTRRDFIMAVLDGFHIPHVRRAHA